MLVFFDTIETFFSNDEFSKFAAKGTFEEALAEIQERFGDELVYVCNGNQRQHYMNEDYISSENGVRLFIERYDRLARKCDRHRENYHDNDNSK